jgi:hypothetical protein
MIEAKEIDGELWIKASDHHQSVKKAFEQIAEKVKLMPWENDTKDSFLVWLKGQK